MSETKNQAKKRNYSAYRNQSSEEANPLLWPVLMIVIILPLIVKMYNYNPELAKFEWYSAGTLANDLFLYYKQCIFGILAGLMFCILAYQGFMNKKNLRFIPIFAPLGVYAALCLVSTIVSKYSDFGVSGIFEQFENVFCLLGYALVVYYIFITVKSKKDVRLLINAIAIGALLMGLLGAAQAFGYDPFSFDFVKKLIASKGYPYQDMELTFEKGRAYATLYNPNYLGVYCTLMIPLFTVLIPFAKKIWEKILYIVVVLTMLISMFASQSKAGLVAIIFAGLVIVVLLRKTLIKKWMITVPSVIAVVVLFFVINALNHNAYLNSVKNAFTVTKSAAPALSSIETKKDGVYVTYNQTTFQIQIAYTTAEDGVTYPNFTVMDEAGKAMPFQASGDGTKYTISNEKLTTIFFYPVVYGETNAFSINIDGKDWYFTTLTEDGSYKYFNIFGKQTDIVTAKSAVFTGYESLATKRGFIWSRTIPLLAKYPIIGSGADTFSIAFPQNDYVGLYNYGYDNQIITKPHSWYLQVGVQTGTLSLLALLVFYGMYFVQSIILYTKRNFDTFLSQMGVGLFIGTIGYMISGITNDSSITVAPVFWVVIGLGVTVNYMVKNNIER